MQAFDKSGRRLPKQERSAQTVETLFAATVQILEQDGEAALTTNRIAQVAGFSVGTLYQYFPSKDMLVRAMTARMQQQVLAQIDAFFTQLEQRSGLREAKPRQVLEEAIGMVVNTMTSQGQHKTLLRLYWRMEETDQTALAVAQIAARLALFFERVQPHLNIRTPTPSEVFVLTRSILGVVRSASLEKSPLLGSKALVDALSKMAWSLFSAAPWANGP
jgi:AcrR family transcriptional regulator